MQSTMTRQESIKLSAKQSALFKRGLKLRAAANAATSKANKVWKELNLPKFEGEAKDIAGGFTFAVLDDKGKKIGECQGSHREGYSVPPGWVNKYVSTETTIAIEKTERIAVKS